MSIHCHNLNCLQFVCNLFCNGSAANEIYTLSLHDALPILTVYSASKRDPVWRVSCWALKRSNSCCKRLIWFSVYSGSICRSEEHTSELQSQFHLVCRLLLEKKKTNNLLENTTRHEPDRPVH